LTPLKLAAGDFGIEIKLRWAEAKSKEERGGERDDAFRMIRAN